MSERIPVPSLAHVMPGASDYVMGVQNGAVRLFPVQAVAGAMSITLQPPTGFDWVPPVRVLWDGSSFSGGFVAEQWMVSPAATLYVDVATGSDTTGTGTVGSPYKSIKKGLSAAALLSASTVTIYVAAGVYDRNNHWNGTACDKHLNIIAVGGEVVSSTRYEAQTWTLHAPGVYKATRSAVVSVRDESFQVSYTVDEEEFSHGQKLEKEVLLADCVSTASTWHTDGTTVYVHTADGRSPDDQVLLLAGVNNVNYAFNKRYYIEGIAFEGSLNDCFSCTSSTIGASSVVVFNGCRFRYAQANGMAATGIPLVVSNDCHAYACDADGFGYHKGVNLIEIRAVEINCRAYGLGTLDGTNNDNGSTVHEDSRILRVNGKYFSTVGPVIADINTSMSWNVNCTARDSASTVADATNTAFLATDTAQMWLDHCVAASSLNAAHTVTSGVVSYRDCTLAGAVVGDVVSY